ncbi:uncharacterized protein [Drosophila takahashii]|uniref:uncharacterized protein n=1 Tax=Drosophila takahashii TaxID=29030 RepID=UPI001CF913E8|nr:uncharacterized protein LOC108060104 [Drosophila takahashii]
MGLVDKFLYCIDVKYGVVIVGFVDIILSLLCGCYLPWIRRKWDWDFTILTEAPMSTTEPPRFYTGPDFYFNRFGYSMYIFCLVVLILHIGACVMAITSTLSDERWMAAPYIATGIMRFVVLLIILTWIVTKAFDCTTTFWLIGLSLFSATYFWLTVLSWFTPPSTE